MLSLMCGISLVALPLCCCRRVMHLSHIIPCTSSLNVYLQLILNMGLAVLVGLLSEYFVSDRTEEQTRNAYLYSMALTLATLLSAFVHNHGFLQAQEIGVLVYCDLYGHGGASQLLWHLSPINLLVYQSAIKYNSSGMSHILCVVGVPRSLSTPTPGSVGRIF